MKKSLKRILCAMLVLVFIFANANVAFQRYQEAQNDIAKLERQKVLIEAEQPANQTEAEEKEDLRELMAWYEKSPQFREHFEKLWKQLVKGDAQTSIGAAVAKLIVKNKKRAAREKLAADEIV